MRWNPFSFAFVLVVLSLCAAAPAEPTYTLKPRGSHTIPGQTTITNQNRQSVLLGELSGIAWLGGDEWLAIGDKSNLLVRLTIMLDPDDGELRSLRIDGCATLKGPIRDLEGIVYTGVRRNSIFVSEEDTPAIREYSLDSFSELPGSPFPTPKVFRGANLRTNRGFESLTAKPDLTELWTATEETLVTDGDASNFKQGATVRLQRYVPIDGKPTPTNQLAYVTDPVFRLGSGINEGCGLCDMVEFGDGTLLTLERAVVWDASPLAGIIGPKRVPSVRARIFQVDRTDATDVRERSSLANGGFIPVKKKLLWQEYCGFDNFEGIGLGPATHNGWVVIAICDNSVNSTKGAMGTRIQVFEARRSGVATTQP